MRVAAADQAVADEEQLLCLAKIMVGVINLLAVASPAQSASQGFMQRVALPHSEACAVWQPRQTIALRVLFLLECVQGWLTPGAPNTHVLVRMPHGCSETLTVLIFETLHECLSGKEQPHLSASMHVVEAVLT